VLKNYLWLWQNQRISNPAGEKKSAGSRSLKTKGPEVCETQTPSGPEVTFSGLDLEEDSVPTCDICKEEQTDERQMAVYWCQDCERQKHEKCARELVASDDAGHEADHVMKKRMVSYEANFDAFLESDDLSFSSVAGLSSTFGTDKTFQLGRTWLGK
jgi:hypothetical protein